MFGNFFKFRIAYNISNANDRHALQSKTLIEYDIRYFLATVNENIFVIHLIVTNFGWTYENLVDFRAVKI